VDLASRRPGRRRLQAHGDKRRRSIAERPRDHAKKPIIDRALRSELPARPRRLSGEEDVGGRDDDSPPHIGRRSNGSGGNLSLDVEESVIGSTRTAGNINEGFWKFREATTRRPRGIDGPQGRSPRPAPHDGGDGPRSPTGSGPVARFISFHGPGDAPSDPHSPNAVKHFARGDRSLVPTLPRGNIGPRRSASLGCASPSALRNDAERPMKRSHAGAWERGKMLNGVAPRLIKTKLVFDRPKKSSAAKFSGRLRGSGLSLRIKS
jgi:hypothetical protein